MGASRAPNAELRGARSTRPAPKLRGASSRNEARLHGIPGLFGALLIQSIRGKFEQVFPGRTGFAIAGPSKGPDRYRQELKPLIHPSDPSPATIPLLNA